MTEAIDLPIDVPYTRRLLLLRWVRACGQRKHIDNAGLWSAGASIRDGHLKEMASRAKRPLLLRYTNCRRDGRDVLDI